ncbi:MAG: ESPR domain-containing protein, partial [Megasphaera sp.]|nr:ESPR domain-containing protein [Megasphaera sp.]
MNKIYKVIFNKTKGVYEVVSELAHSHSKPKALEQSKLKTLAVFMGCLLSLGVNSLTVMAYDTANGTTTQGLVDGYYIGSSFRGYHESHSASVDVVGYATKDIQYSYYDNTTEQYKSAYIPKGHWYFSATRVSHDKESGLDSSHVTYLDLGTSPFGDGSTLSDEQKQVVKDLIKNVDGDQTVKGNQTTTGNSETKGNSTTDGSSTVKGNQTVSGTTNTTNLNVSGDTNLHNTTITGDSHVTNNQT